MNVARTGLHDPIPVTREVLAGIQTANPRCDI